MYTRNYISIKLFIWIPLFFTFQNFGIADEYSQYQDSTIISRDNLQQIPVANSLSTSFTKYVYTYLFGSLLNLKIDSDYGSFLFLQDYQGSYLKIDGEPTRDDEHWSFNYLKQLNNNIGFVIKQNWHFTSDSRDIGLNQLMRLNGSVGLQYEPFDNGLLQVLYGIENNNQLDLKSNGSIISLNSQADNISFENFILHTKLSGNFVNLKDGRKNRDIDAMVRFNRILSDESEFNLSAIYRNLQNNLIGYKTFSETFPIETRNENSFDGNFNIKYKVIDKLKFSFDFRIQNMNVAREYKSNFSEIPYSFFNRQINHLDLMGNAGIDFGIENFQQKLYFGFTSRSEKNNLNEKYLGGDLLKYQNFEFQRDNNSGKYNIYSNSIYNFNNSTYFLCSYFLQLFRYDTPSEFNFDDRDELSNILNLRFYHKFSNYLSLMLEFENRQNHLVYIFSERSSLNNRNKVYRFSPQISYMIGNFIMNPKVEVLANYTVYDYSKINSSMNSISFRQIAYSDSIYYKISEKISIHSNWKIKYSERGILFWDEFSESPQSGNREIFAKIILRRNFASDFWIGSGMNFFKYSQISLRKNSQIDYNLESISPEITFNYVYNKWTLSILGWYEFQTIKSIIKNQITNLSINVNLLF